MASAILGEKRDVLGELDLSQVMNLSKLDLAESKAAVTGDEKVPEAGASDKGRVIVFKNGKRMELVSLECINSLLALPPRKPIRPVDHELIDSLTALDPKIREAYRRSAVSLFETLQAERDHEADILRQYEATGQAFVEYDDDEYDDDENEDDDDEDKET
ncbi:hypothetical protein ZWY2020_048617 [Hordeum vulgare]|nr:hypothetical protein ZWY2020_048617 [Hordeum vulgare]